MPIVSMICFTIAALILTALFFRRRYRNRAHDIANVHDGKGSG